MGQVDRIQFVPSVAQARDQRPRGVAKSSDGTGGAPGSGSWTETEPDDLDMQDQTSIDDENDGHIDIAV